MTSTRNAAIQMILAVLRDGSRSDRFLQRADDGHYYTTPDREYLSADGGSYTVPAVRIGVSDGGIGEDEEEEVAVALMGELDEMIDAATAE